MYWHNIEINLFLKRSLILRSVIRFPSAIGLCQQGQNQRLRSSRVLIGFLLILLHVKPISCPFIGTHWKILVIYRCEPNYWRHQRFSYDIKWCSGKTHIELSPLPLKRQRGWKMSPLSFLDTGHVYHHKRLSD